MRGKKKGKENNGAGDTSEHWLKFIVHICIIDNVVLGLLILSIMCHWGVYGHQINVGTILEWWWGGYFRYQDKKKKSKLWHVLAKIFYDM